LLSAQSLPHVEFFFTPISGDRRIDIFKWLSPVIPSENYNEAQEMRVQGTGMWFIESEPFFEWRTTADSFLWIHGKRRF
jgi:hypothetical protein